MIRHLVKENMDQAKGYEHVRYTAPDPRDEGIGSMNQRFSHDSSTNVNTNVRPPDYGISTPARPVLNYSIQTGEEFAFEFMRDRVIMKPQFIPNMYGEPSGMPVSVNLSAMGMVHPMSETGSKTIVLNKEEKRHTFEQERKPPSRIEDKTYHELVQSAPVVSSRNDTGRRLHSLVSSRASDSSLNLAKFLCSFGGKIIPRPRDQKLRYVGGETRIIRISKTISFQELMHKMTEMFPEARTIKYQLPGEDLDALVSVSSDEDLQNMMEECIVFGNGGSEKPRMFLFSSSDIEEAQFVMEATEGDSEVQYVVAVNGMDLSSRKSSLGTSAPGNNLDEQLHKNIDMKISRAATEPAVASVAPSAGNESLSASQTSQPVTGFSTGNEPFSQPYLGQQLHFTGLGNHQVYTSAHMASIGYIDEKGSAPLHVQPQPHYIPYSVNPETPLESLVPHYPQKSEQGILREEQIFHKQEPEASSKEAKVRRDDSFQKVNDPANVSTVESNLSAKEPKMRRESSTPRVSEYSVSSMPGDLIVPDHVLKEEAPIATQISSSTPDPSSSVLPEKSLRKSQDHVESNLSAKEPKMKKEHSTTRDNEYSVSSVSSDSMVPDHVLKEEAPVSMKISNSTPDPKSFVYPEKSLRTSQEYVPKTGALDTVSEGMKKNQDNQFCLPEGFSASGHVASDGDSSNLSNVDQPVIHQRVFHSERTLRDTAETNRLSKSDDSLGSQFVMAQTTSEAFLPISESSETFHEANMESQNVHSTAPVRPAPESIWTAEGSMPQSEKRNFEPKAPEHVSQTETSVKAVPRGHTEKGDIVVDINDRFPRDFLADILRAKESMNFPGLGPLHADGAGVSLNIQNDDPKTWSYFRNLAEEFERKDLSLMDQDHPGFPTSLTNTNGVPIDYSYPPLQSEKVASSQINPQIHFDGNIQPVVSTTTVADLNTVGTQEDYSQPQIKGAESTDATVVSLFFQPKYGKSDKFSLLAKNMF